MTTTNSYAETVAKEALTHRHLAPSDPLQNGDIYGGTDWGFVYAIGTPETAARAGDHAGTLMAYRPRRLIPRATPTLTLAGEPL